MRAEMLHMTIGPSPLLMLLLLATACLASRALVANNLIEGEAQGLLLALTLLAAMRSLRAKRPLALTCHGENWQMDLGSGPMPVQPCRPMFIGHWFTVLNLKPEHGSAMTLVLGRDSVPPDQYRRLRVLLRHGPSSK